MGKHSVSSLSSQNVQVRQDAGNTNQARGYVSRFRAKVVGLQNKLYRNTIKPVLKRVPKPVYIAKPTKILAEKYGGERTWVFRQSSPAVSRLLKGEEKKGVCDSLTAYWMQAKSQNLSLKDDLGEQSRQMFATGRVFTRETSLDTEKLKRIASNHGVLRNGDQLGTYFAEQLAGAEVQLTYNTDLSLSFDPFEPQGPEGIVDKIIARLSNLEAGNIAEIGIYARSSGHAMGVEFSSEGTVSFFDPNAGEFSFASKDDFLDFFREFYEQVYIQPMRRPFDSDFKLLVFDKAPKLLVVGKDDA